MKRVSTVAKWEPIETAPLDGTRVLVAVVRHKNDFVGVGYFAPIGMGARPVWFIDGIYSTSDAAPTHWMPLPEPPK